jgi:hypothetical protein
LCWHKNIREFGISLHHIFLIKMSQQGISCIWHEILEFFQLHESMSRKKCIFLIFKKHFPNSKRLQTTILIKKQSLRNKSYDKSLWMIKQNPFMKDLISKYIMYIINQSRIIQFMTEILSIFMQSYTSFFVWITYIFSYAIFNYHSKTSTYFCS